MSKNTFKKNMKRNFNKRFVYTPPNDEQLVNFVSTIVIGPSARLDQKRIVKDELDNFPDIKKVWLDYHKELQMKALELA